MRIQLILVMLGAVLVGAPLRAQRPVHLGLAGGLSLPQGDLGGAFESGWHVRGMALLSLPALPIGLRAEVSQERYSGGTAPQTLELRGGAVDLLLSLPAPAALPVRPYVLAGAGLYHAKTVSLEPSPGASFMGGGSHMAWNAGLGTSVDIGPLQAFVEARYQAVRLRPHARALPLTLGVMF